MRVTSLDDYVQLASALPGWVFRGQRSAKWFLEPSVERLVVGRQMTWPDAERRAIAAFQSYSEADLAYRPEQDDYLGWLALLQHYGGPSRLLDFTHAPQVAAFFALEDLPSEPAAVWAVNELILVAFLEDQLRTPLPGNCDLRRYPDRWWFFNKCYTAKFTGYAAGVAHPASEDRRLRAQRSTFLFSLNSGYTLAENLFGMFDLDPGAMRQRSAFGFFTDAFADSVLRKLQKSPVLKIELAFPDPLEALQELAQRGVSRASLFPGIDGYTCSLRHSTLFINHRDLPPAQDDVATG